MTYKAVINYFTVVSLDGVSYIQMKRKQPDYLILCTSVCLCVKVFFNFNIVFTLMELDKGPDRHIFHHISRVYVKKAQIL